MHILRGSEWYMMAIVEIPKTDPVINLSTDLLRRMRSIHFYRLSHSELDDIEKVAVCSSLRLLKNQKSYESYGIIPRGIANTHRSDTKVLTMKMEILLEPTSNKLLVGKYGDSDGYTFDDPILILEILSRRFLLRGIYLITGSSKDGDGDTSFQWS
ncbi:hypothetical protein Tco_1440669 [Tanacetum coccineum]